jgi:hypothetical protein
MRGKGLELPRVLERESQASPQEFETKAFYFQSIQKSSLDKRRSLGNVHVDIGWENHHNWSRGEAGAWKHMAVNELKGRIPSNRRGNWEPRKKFLETRELRAGSQRRRVRNRAYAPAGGRPLSLYGRRLRNFETFDFAVIHINICITFNFNISGSDRGTRVQLKEQVCIKPVMLGFRVQRHQEW